MNRMPVPCLIAVLAAAIAAPAADPVDAHPGYFAIESLGLLSADAVQVDVDLSGPMLRMVAAVLEGQAEDRAFATLVGRLDRIRVQVGEIHDAGDLGDARRRFAEATARLDGDGWQRIVLVREDAEMAAVYVKGDETRLDGITVLALDDEIALVNLVGSIEPAELGRLLADLDQLPALDELDLGQIPSGEER